MTPNPGCLPEEAVGKRVRVILRKDAGTMTEPQYADALNPMAPPGWAADGRNGCRWSLKQRGRDPAFDILFYEVIG